MSLFITLTVLTFLNAYNTRIVSLVKTGKMFENCIQFKCWSHSEKTTAVISLICTLVFSLLNTYQALFNFKIHYSIILLKLIPQDARIKAKTSDITALEKELNTISVFNEFAKHFKLQRRITKLKDEKKEIVKNQAFKKMKIKYFLVIALYVIIFGCIIKIIWSDGSESVAQVPAHWFWPVAQLFDWSNGMPGYISVPCWVAISSSASKSLAKIF